MKTMQEPEIDPEDLADELKSFIQSGVIERAKKEGRERIIEAINNFYIMKGGKIDRLPEPEHRMTNLLNENMEIGYSQACRDIINLITNK